MHAMQRIFTMPALSQASTAPPLSHATAKRVNSEERESAIAYFTSAEFLKPYGADAWRWFPPTIARPPMSQGDLRAALLNAAEYLDASLDAQLAGDDAGVREALEVLAAIIKVALGSSSGSGTLQ
jgi:hypothetical protein